jgi:hypothetical protein
VTPDEGFGRRLRLVTFALAPLVVLLLVLEGALWLAGLGDPDERLSLTRGFSEEARYLLPDPDHPGGWVTQMSDGSYAEQAIPRKGERVRVILFGGSSTMGFPTGYLQRRLEALVPRPGVEVINLGRAGYGSERVLILLRQAMVLEPDIVFLYCGNNEFIEAGFALELIEQWKQPWITRAIDRLSRLRTLNVLVSLAEGLRTSPAGAAPRPEDQRPAHAEFQHLTYAQTLGFYEVYRKNLEAMLRISREHGAGVLLSTVIGNMFFPPVVAGLPEASADQPNQAQLTRLVPTVGLIPERFRKGLLQTGSDDPSAHLDPRDWGEAISPDEMALRAALGVGREPPALRPLAPPFDTGPWWDDPAYWTDRPMPLLQTMAALHARDLADGERRAIERAAALLEDLSGTSPDLPLVLYPLGLCTYLLGRDDARAEALLRDAARYDRAPTRANDVTNGVVRALAATHPEVVFVDAEALAPAVCPSGLISYELMMDNCHLHHRALPRLMDLFVPGLADLAARVTRGATGARDAPGSLPARAR